MGIGNIASRSAAPKFDAAAFAERLIKGLDAKLTTPETVGDVLDLSALKPAQQKAVFKEIDKRVAQEDAKKYYDALDSICSSARIDPAFLSGMVMGAGMSMPVAPAEGQSKQRDLHATEVAGATAKKPVAAAPEGQDPMDGIEGIRRALDAQEAALRATKMPAAQKKKMEKTLEATREILNVALANAAGSVGMMQDRLASKVDRATAAGGAKAVTAQAQAAAVDQQVRKDLKDILMANPQVAAAVNAQAAAAAAAPAGVPVPAAGASAAALLGAGMVPGMNPKIKGQLEKASSELRNISRSQQIISMIDSGMPIEKILLAVMLLFFEDSDEKLKQKMKEQALKQEELEALKSEQEALRNGDPAAIERLVAQETREIVANEAGETVQQAGHVVSGGDDASKNDPKNKAKAAQSGQASGHEVLNTPAAQLARKKAEANADALKQNQTVNAAEAQAAQQAAGDGTKPPVDDAAPPQANPGTVKPPLTDAEKAAIVEKRLEAIQAKVDHGGGSMQQFNFEVQFLMEARKNMLELVSKLLSDISQQISTIIRNI